MRITERMPRAVRAGAVALVVVCVLGAAVIFGGRYLRVAEDSDARANILVTASGNASPLPDLAAPPAEAASAPAVAGLGSAVPRATRPPTPARPTPTPTRPDRSVQAAGFPHAADTGVPARIALRKQRGEIIVRKPGTVIDGIDLVGKISVEADNVTIRRSRITAPADLPNKGRDEFTVVQQATNAKGLVLEDCEIDGSGLVYRAVNATNAVRVNRCEMRNVGHGVQAGDNFTVENSWIHSTTAGPDDDWHVDGVISSIGVNGVVRRNTIVLTGGGLTATVSIGSSLGRIDNILIENNLLAGGNYCVYIQDQGHPATRIRVVNNRFSIRTAPKVGVYGIWYPSQLPKDLVRRGNKIHETGAAADEEPDWG